MPVPPLLSMIFSWCVSISRVPHYIFLTLPSTHQLQETRQSRPGQYTKEQPYVLFGPVKSTYHEEWRRQKLGKEYFDTPCPRAFDQVSTDLQFASLGGERSRAQSDLTESSSSSLSSYSSASPYQPSTTALPAAPSRTSSQSVVGFDHQSPPTPPGYPPGLWHFRNRDVPSQAVPDGSSTRNLGDEEVREWISSAAEADGSSASHPDDPSALSHVSLSNPSREVASTVFSDALAASPVPSLSITVYAPVSRPPSHSI